jgi:hypothetical protein
MYRNDMILKGIEEPLNAGVEDFALRVRIGGCLTF